MPILGSSNSAANKGMLSKQLTNGDTIIWLSRKYRGKKEKLLITSNFSFSLDVFESCLLLKYQNEYLWSKGLKKPTYFSSAHTFNQVQHFIIW